MSLGSILTAAEILNRTAAEVGVVPIASPYGTSDPIFVQMQYLLNIAGEELLYLYPWEMLNKKHTITVAPGDDGEYDMPLDFAYIVNDTAWDESNRVPLGGPLSPQDWTWLEGRNLGSNTVYASFRINDGKFNIFPDVPAEGTVFSFEYQSLFWAIGDGDVTQIGVTGPGDRPLYDRTLITRMLKVKYLEAAGFDTTKSQADLNQMFSLLTGREKGAGVLSAGNSRRTTPLLSMRNAPHSGYGL